MLQPSHHFPVTKILTPTIQSTKWILFKDQKVIQARCGRIFWEAAYIDTGEYFEILETTPLGKVGNDVFALARVGQIRWSDYELKTLRDLLYQLNTIEGQICSYAAQILVWLQDYKYCNRCAGLLKIQNKEHSKYCSVCKLFFYPRINPCVMVLVYSGEWVLLVREKRYKKGHYSAVAGFIEAGESAEQAAHREVMEETGLTLGKLEYFSSQSWPFPHSLMLAYFGQYADGELQIDHSELEDARWFTRDALPPYPRKPSISESLINSWRDFCK